MPDWDAETYIALGSAAVALAGVVYNVGMKKISRRSAVASEKSADAGATSASAAKLSADAAERAAAAAERSADEAAKVARVELDRWHQEMAPPHPGILKPRLHKPDNGRGRAWFAGTIDLPRSYRVLGEAHFTGGNGYQSLPIGLFEAGPKQLQFFLADAPQNPETAPFGTVVLRFWPPLPGDEPHPWSCTCGRPDGATGEGAGHWELRIPIDWHRQVSKGF